MKKIDKNYIFLILIALAFVFVVIPSSHMFGSTTDWVSQHISFPDYFRKLFYETGNLFPNFAPSLGGGQNIFHFSYYGLFHPFILLSYLFPFIDMTSYVIGMNVFLYILSGLLFYTWLKRHFSSFLSFFGSLLLLCATPILFHFHRHFMFVSYMPFLILGFMGVERYFEKGKSILLVFSTFFIILMSYFYSIPSILAFVLYGVFCYIKREKEITFIKFMKDGICFVYPIFLGILLSAFFLVPTFYTVLSGRGGGSSFSLWELLFPKLNVGAFVYDPYGMGLTSLAVISLLYGLFDRKREYKFLAITLLCLVCFPIFSYFLNGTLYIRSKVFIPFIPLFLFLVCHFVEFISKHELSFRFFLSIFVIHLFFLFCGFDLYFYYVDVFLTLLMIYFISKSGKKKGVYFFLFIPFCAMMIANRLDTFVNTNVYKESTSVSPFLLQKLKEEEDFVRTYHFTNGLYNVNKIHGSFYHVDSLYSSIYHQDYMYFYKNIFKNPLSYRNRLIVSQNNNLLYQIYMGGKYLYSDKEMIGYKKISNHVYQNDDVFPVLYVNYHVMSEKEFSRKKYPYSVLALMENVVVDGNFSHSVSNVQVQKDLALSLSSKKNLDIIRKKNGYLIKARKNNELVLSLPETLSNKMLLLDFELDKEWNCKKGDSFIVINGIKNKLTCSGAIYKNQNKHFHYVISDPVLHDLRIHFEKGDYFLSNVHMYVIDYEEIQNIHNDFTKMNVDKKKSKGDLIVGGVDALEDGYFVTSIPYDIGFTIYDNGKKVDYEKVNTAFLGFPIQKGFHHIRIEYRSPFFFTGKCISFLGFFLVFVLLFREYTHKTQENKYNRMSKKVKKI